jgi:hypothetical protein
MSAGIIAVLLIAAGTLAFVVAPLLRGDAAEAERVAVAMSEAAELQSRREMLLAALKDLEDDHATAKIDDADYGELYARLSRQAVEVMKQLDGLDAESDGRPANQRGPVAVPRNEPPEEL